MLLIIHSITSAETKQKEIGNISRSFSLLFSSIKKGGTHTQKKKKTKYSYKEEKEKYAC